MGFKGKKELTDRGGKPHHLLAWAGPLHLLAGQGEGATRMEPSGWSLLAAGKARGLVVLATGHPRDTLQSQGQCLGLCASEAGRLS